MSGLKKLTNRQLAVIEDLFAGRLEEQEILDKYKLGRRLYNKWRNDDAFNSRLEKRIAEAYHQSAVLIARYAPVAAAKLIQLTDSDRPETARKACLDIISMPVHIAGLKDKSSDTPQPDETSPSVPLNPETAGKLLAVLAEEQPES
ncbi:MAG: hypothetical protein JW837_16445 [Sedimentisphaerales bacterium]|nr:hypothetical protein [Sedimentisphaerales bacterium]